ncbi:MAG TPA: amidohydrolase family protein [Candidatus Binataceae bacterium]|jgi:N-acyl-D-amino-acid deacylase|nr:amidohydrolase family protein [Candidatus Binataceae bacterium]
MPYDMLIRNGTMVDGTGAPRRRADVAIADGRIAKIGRVSDGARRTIDASDLVVAPGFFDPHTHYDAQICWDPLITCSSWHGVTSVVMGNCGVGIAPCKPDFRETATWDLVNVEGIPFDVLSRGIRWEWESFPQFMDAAAHRESALNLGFFAPLTPFRHYVMGEESMQRAAHPEEIGQIKQLIKQAVTAGAVGFSTTNVRQHIGYGNLPIACRQASREEFKAYANALKELGKGSIEIQLTQEFSTISDEEYAFLDLLLTHSGRPVTWGGVAPLRRDTDKCMRMLDRADPLTARGGIAQIPSHAAVIYLDLRNPQIMASMNSWNAIFNQPPREQIQIYRSQRFRDAFRTDLKQPQIFTGNWDRVRVMAVANPAGKSAEGVSVKELSTQRRQDPLDTFLDFAIEHDLNMQYQVQEYGDELLGPLLTDARTMIGLADGGAHVDMICNADYPSFLLGHWVREQQLLSLEQAIRRITSQPADVLGFPQRGRLAAGLPADVTIFDPDAIGSDRRAQPSRDLPGGGFRFTIPGRGINYTIVNGQVVFDHGQHTGAFPGQVLRSGVSKPSRAFD